MSNDQPILYAAKAYTAAGYRVVPVPFRSKAPVLDGWQKLRLRPEELSEHFNGVLQNIGILCGEPSGGLVDVDLDCPEAQALAHVFVPDTGMVHGREGSPRSHRWFVARDGVPEKVYRFQDLPDGAGKRKTLVELRSSGGQTVVPPSVHPCGEVYVWEGGSAGLPVDLDGNSLLRSVRLMAVCVLLARHYPGEGTRHEYALALAGGMLRHGYTAEETSLVVGTAARLGGDEEERDRVRAVADTSEALLARRKASGFPRLRKLIDPQIVDKITDWLGIGAPTDGANEGPDNAGEKTTSGRASAATRLVQIGSAAQLFRTDRDESFARFAVGDHLETWAVRSKAFRQYLGYAFYKETGKPPNAQATEEALNMLEAMARFEGPHHALDVRVAGAEGAVWYDLGSDRWDAVCVDRDGWRVEGESPPVFRRYTVTGPQVTPVSGGRLEKLRDFLNVRDERTFRLLVASLVAALIPNIAHPVLIFHGEKGAAKTTSARLVARLIDPSKAEVRSAPRRPEEWIQAADHSLVVVIDNISKMPRWLSDSVCRASTGEADTRRALYTNNEDILFAFRRVVILTGIEAASQEHDLLDRAVLLGLEPIPEDRRRSEAELLSEFERERSCLLGALFDLLASVMRELPNVRPATLPRMADFARIGLAVERASGWPAGSFMRAYQSNIADQNEEALAASAVGDALRVLMEGGNGWEGTPAELLAALNAQFGTGNAPKPDGWPKSPRGMSGQLKRIASALRGVGILTEHVRSNGVRRIVLRKTLAVTGTTGTTGTTEGDGLNRTVTDDAEEVPVACGEVPVRSNPAPTTNRRRDGSDGSDGCTRTLPEPADDEEEEWRP
jgi:hypothetical protein